MTVKPTRAQTELQQRARALAEAEIAPRSADVTGMSRMCWRSSTGSCNLARLVGGDAPLMPQMAAAATLGAAVTMPAALAILV